MVHVNESDVAIVIRMEDDLDLVSSPGLEATIRQAARDIVSGQGVVVSLDECRYCDATGLTALLRGKMLLGPRFSVVLSADSPVRRILRITQLERRLSVCASYQEAIDGFGIVHASDRLRDLQQHWPVSD